MTTQKASFLFLLSLTATLCQAQHAGNIHYRPELGQAAVSSVPLAPPPLDENYFYLHIDALYNKVPSAYLAIFNVVQLGKDAEEAHQLMQERVGGLLKNLKEIGISGEAVFVDMISQIPIYEYQLQKKVFSKSYQEVPAGIELQKNLHIQFRDGSKMDQILALAARHEIYELIKVDYQVDNQQQVYQALREAAFSQVRQQLKAYQMLGVQYDTLPMIFAESQMVSLPLHRYISYQSKSGATLENKIRDSAQVKQFRQAQTVYYQGIPTDEYEIVINPVVKEPVVQFTYQLQVRFQRFPPQPQVRVQREVQREKEFIILTPDGNTRTLHVESSTERP